MHMIRALPATVAVCSAVLFSVVTGCSQESAAQRPATGPALPLPRLTDEVRDGRGGVLVDEPVDELSAPLSEARATQHQIVYRSVSGIDGTMRDVSGTVFVPAGPPPDGGWPIVAYGHGTTGIGNDCGPSRYQNLLGYDLVVASLIKLGFVVALTDYEGLGMPGRHPYLEPRTAAFNMIDSVRAARNIVPTTSVKWFAVGVEQGGQAAWAANEMVQEYGTGLEFLGSASMRPAVDLSAIATLAKSKWLTKAQQSLLPTYVYGLQATNPNLNPDDYLHGVLERDKDPLLACSGPLVAEIPKLMAQMTIDDSEPISAEATEALRAALTEYALPQRRATGPMLVITGERDEIVRSQWVAGAVEKACALGDVVEFISRPREGQTDLDGGPRLAQWLSERLAGDAPVDTCER